MTRVLIVNSSPNPDSSVSRALTEHFAKTWQDAHPNAEIVSRDVGLAPLPHIDQDTIGAYYTPEDARSEEQKELLALSDSIVEEALSADVIVIGSPMHNFGITSGLKAWIDHVARVGLTFSYTENGPVGHLGGRKVYVLTTRGGAYSNGAPAATMDHQEPYLRTALGFVGLDDVNFIHAEGMAGGTGGQDRAVVLIEQAISENLAVAA
ncbi:MAG: FMN-dependent NADH-azoreductase [Rhodospirillales bacterium]|jgi:FMN-dependent NADH-azoreductase|nr:FMN-dependent NADH-azoreductase [Rhodospirillales bacterium]